MRRVCGKTLKIIVQNLLPPEIYVKNVSPPLKIHVKNGSPPLFLNFLYGTISPRMENNCCFLTIAPSHIKDYKTRILTS